MSHQPSCTLTTSFYNCGQILFCRMFPHVSPVRLLIQYLASREACMIFFSESASVCCWCHANKLPPPPPPLLTSTTTTTTFNSVFGFWWSFHKSFVHRSPDNIWRGSELGHCFFCVIYRQFACRHCWTTRPVCTEPHVSRWICRSVRQQSPSAAIFSKFWK